MDGRLSWFARRINDVFGMGADADAVRLFAELLDGDGAPAKRRLVRLLGPSTVRRTVDANVFYAYTTAVTRTVREEVEVDEELTELEVQSLRESDGRKKKKRHHPEKKKKKKHVHADDALASGGDSPATDSDKDSDDGKSRDGYSSPDTAIQMADEDGTKKYSERLFKKVKVTRERTITLPELHVRFGRTAGGDLDADVRCLYFVRNTDAAIPAYGLPEEADLHMPAHFLVGSRSAGCPAKTLATELSAIWMPCVRGRMVEPFARRRDHRTLVRERPDDYEETLHSVHLDRIISLGELFTLEPSSFRHVHELASSEPLKQNFLTKLQCLVDKLEWTIDYASEKRSSSVTGCLSGLAEDNVDETALTVERTPALMLQCVDTLENWISKMKTLCASVSECRDRDTVHSELAFWRNSDASVRSIVDELGSAGTRLFLDVIGRTAGGDGARPIGNVWREFQTVRAQFDRSCGLAKDNLKYISLVMERHEDFMSADFNAITGIVPVWFDGLRTIWVLSPYFGKHANMLRLLLQISNGLCENVRRNLGDLRTIFKTRNVGEIAAMSLDATEMLDVWSTGYLETRKSIEKSKFERWEFDKRALFNRTEYVKRMARDIHEIAATISQFLNILGPELRSVIKDMVGLDVMISRVKSLYRVFDAIDFDLFCEDNVENWNLFLKEFHSEVLRVEDECKLFIDWCFDNLRSCKEAYSSLEKLQQFASRPVFKEQLKTKYEAILRQYENELTTIETLFLTRRDDPPVSRHHPPVAGAIFWARMLFDKITEPIAVFQSADEFDVPLRDKVMDMYESVADHMKRYERTKIADWTAEARPLAARQMDSNVLAVRRRTNDEDVDGGRGNNDTTRIDVEDFEDWSRCTGGPDKILSDGGSTFVTNFNVRVYELMDEAETMEVLGIVLPADIRTLLAKKNTLLDDIMKVDGLVDAYNSFVSSMDDPELVLLRRGLREIEDHLRAGLCRYNWLSASVASFADDGLALIDKTRSRFDNIRTVESRVSRTIASFENVNLFPTDILDVDDWQLTTCETSRQRPGLDAFRTMAAGCRTISHWLTRLETDLFGGRTGGARGPMSGTYANCGDRIVAAITKAYAANLCSYNGALLGDDAHVVLTADVTADGRVTAVPNAYVAYNNVMRNVSERLRWLTALPAWPADGTRDGQHAATGRTDGPMYGVVADDRAVRRAIETTRTNARVLMVKVNRYLKKWERFRFLWNGSKITDMSVRDYENVFNDLNRLLLYFANTPSNKQIHCVRLELGPMIDQMERRTRKRIWSYADLLLTSTRQMIRRQGDVFDTYKTSMEREITDVDGLCDRLRAAERIRTEQADVEIFFQELNRRVYVLEIAGVTAPRDDVTRVRDGWATLRRTASETKSYLERAKAVWSHAVRLDAETFARGANAFLDDCRGRGSTPIDGDDLDAGLAATDVYGDGLDELMRRKRRLARRQRVLFDARPPDDGTLDARHARLERVKPVYALYGQLKRAVGGRSATPWRDVSASSVREVFAALAWSFRRLPVDARDTRPARVLADRLRRLRLGVPVLLRLKNDALKPRHWREMLNAIGERFDDGDVPLSFGTVLRIQAAKHHRHAVQTVLNKAIAEDRVERTLNEIHDRWATTRLDVGKRTDAGSRARVHELRDVRDALQMLEHDQITVHQMMNSCSVEPFLSRVETWQKNLSTVNEVLNKWWFVQQKWIYLAEIYAGKDIAADVLPENAEQFNELNDVYREMMANANRNSKILEQCLNPDIMNKLSWLECRLETSQKELSRYIVEKRNSFPRFYFISDNDLLFVYGNPDPFAMQDRIVQIFDNIKSLDYELDDGQSTRAVTSMTTCNDEVLKFKNNVIVKNAVDKWMLKVIDQMQKSNRYLIKKAILDLGNTPCSSSRCGWINSFPESVCLTADHVWWTAEVEHVLNEINAGNRLNMKRYLNELNGRIDETVVQIKKQMSENTRKKYGSVLIACVHHRDTVESFVVNNVTSARAFEWDSVMKSYWIKSKDNLYIAQCSGVFDYGYEYMGSNNNVAVITPLTNRIFLTFTRALMTGLGGATNGPAGTGKTETTLAMAKMLGNLCKIINCNDGLDGRTVGRFLDGIRRSKIWALFAKFNRLSRNTVSVMSALLSSVKWPLFENGNEIDSRRRDLNACPRFGIFIAVNADGPDGRRRDVDDVVRHHFRPAVCLVPDFEQICFAVLYAAGFVEAKVLSRKLSLLYKLCKEGLSDPLNRTFDLRSLKLVVKTATGLMAERPELEEKTIIVNVLRDLNAPKLTVNDVPLFRSYMTDLFPNAKRLERADGDFDAAVGHALEREKLVRVDGQVEKVRQTMEMLANRNAVAIIGPTGGGKSAVVGALRETLNRTGVPTKLVAVHPQAYTRPELYGRADPAAGTWTDGLLTAVLRHVNQPVVSDDRPVRIVVFDGDVDAAWADDLDPVMDDSRTLTLSNGEVIRIRPQCRLLFEAGHLARSAPSTVSRMGVVYVDPDDLGYRPYWTRWLQQRGPIERTALDRFFHKYVPALFDLIFGRDKTPPLVTAVPQTQMNMTTQLCFVLDAVLPLVSSDVYASSAQETTSDDVTAAPLDSMIALVAGMDVLEAVFIQALYLSPGALLAGATARHAFDDAVKTLSGFAASSRPARRPLRYVPSDQPTWYDYYFDFGRLEWTAWKDAVPEYVHDGAANFGDILVPTVESARLTWTLKLTSEYYSGSAVSKKVRRPIVVVGETGSGKTAAIKHFVRGLPSEHYAKMTLNFSAGTSSSDVRTGLETNLETRSGWTCGPPAGKRLVCFVDDLNLPRTDAGGARRPIALLRSLFDRRRDDVRDRRDRFDWTDPANVCFLGAMDATRGGHQLDPRFLSLCTVFALPGPADDTIRHVFGSVLSAHTANFADDVKRSVQGLVDATVRLYRLALEKLRRTPDKFLNVFNLCHVGRVFDGMTRTSPGAFATAESFVRVWRNEFTRAMCDRLRCRQDRETIERHLAEQLQSRFPAHAEYALRDPLLFGDCRNAVNANGRRRVYEDLIDYDSAFHLFQEISLEYGKRHGPSDAILFDDALDHVVRIHRTLRMDRGHVTVIGRDGDGKKSLAKLAAFASGHEVRVANARTREFDGRLKDTFARVGLDGNRRPAVLIVDGVNATDEHVLASINDVLIDGFAPTLYPDREEKREIVRRFRNERENVSDQVAADVCWEMFLNNCLNNLHVVLLMSPDDNLRSIFRNHPGFVNKTYIDWIHRWPADALKAVAEKIITNDDQVIPDNHVNNVIEQCVYMHTSAQDYAKSFVDRTTICFTFKHLVDLTHMYKRLVEQKSSLSSVQSRQIQNGLEKIDESKLKLCKISETLVQQDKSIMQNNETCENLQRQINGTRVLIEEIIAIVNDSTEKLNVKNEQIECTKEQMNRLIDETLPVLNATRTLANEINSEYLTEIKSVDTPSESATTLLECVAILKGLKDMSAWKNLCEMIEDANFLDSLRELDLNQICQRQQTQVRTKLKFLKKTIDIEVIGQMEHSILDFVESVLNYCSMYHEIVPLKNRIEKAEKHCLDATLKLRDHEDSLKDTRRVLSELEKSLDDVSKENIALIKENRLLKTKFEYADKLIKGLRSVHERWSVDLENHNTLKNQIFGNCLLSSSFLIYAGPFSLEYRKQIVFNDWFNNIVRLQIPIDLNYKLENELIDDKTIYNWNSNGLPCDEYSIQNGVLMTRSNRFPLCIDPHDQGFNWIVNHEKNNSLKVLSFADSDYLVHLRNAVEYGKSVVFIDFENMDLDLKDLLNGNIRSNSRHSEYIEIGDRKYHENFRLYLTTKQTNPTITTSVYSGMTVINCSITQKGLEDQLLDLVVGRETKELKDERDSTLRAIYEHREKLNECKQSFSLEVVGCAGPLIDNALLSDRLDDIGTEIRSRSARHGSSVESMSAVDRSIDVYRPVAKRGALFYTALSGLKAIDPFYQFSIDWFVTVFADSIESATHGDTTPGRISNIIDRLTGDVFEFGCIGIHEKHHALYLFQTACALDKDAGNLSDSELAFFIRGAADMEKRNVDNPTTWLPDKSWQQVVELSANFECFSNLIEHIRSNVGRWQKWYYSTCPETADAIPIRINKYFDVLMLIRCFRTDRVYRTVENYIYQTTGLNNDECIVKKNIDFELIDKKFANLTPCVVILNDGSDPANDLTGLAGKNDITGPAFKALSLGICEQNAINSALRSAMDRGNRLMVQNCTFSVTCLHEIEYLLERANGNWHPDFRLWLVLDEHSLPSHSLPISLLLRSIKVIVEPSNYMRARVHKALETYDPNDLERDNVHVSFKPLLCASLFLHGVLTERGKYNKTGWSLPYEFGLSDHVACRRTIAGCLRTIGNDDDEVPWTALRYLIGEIVYGGKVIDRYDRRIVSTYVDEYFGDFVYSPYQPFSFYDPGPCGRKVTQTNTPGIVDGSDDLTGTADTIPWSVGPEACGLNGNAVFAYRDGLADRLWRDAAKLYADGTSDDGRGETARKTGADILTSLPGPFDVDAVKTFYGDKRGWPTVVVLLSELDKYNALLETVRDSLSRLAKVFLGETEMDDTLEDLSACLYAGRVPDRWRELSPQTVKPLACYVDHLLKRARQYSNWSRIGEPLVVWLSGLHSPRSYLTSLAQLASRKYGWPLERGALRTSVTRWTCESQVQRGPEAGCYVTGLYLYGARWDADSRCLAECASRNALERLPILAVVPVDSGRQPKPSECNSLAVPVYVTTERGCTTDDNCVFEAVLNASAHRSFWILRGVCIVMNPE